MSEPVGTDGPGKAGGAPAGGAGAGKTPAGEAGAAIAVEGLCKLFGDRPDTVMPLVRDGWSKDRILAETGHMLALRDISLTVPSGGVYVIMGLSGSGKSTLVRHFNRLIDPTEGRILLDGVDIMQHGQREIERIRRYDISMVFQRFALMPHRTVIDNVAYGLSVQGVRVDERRERALTWLEAVELQGYGNRYPAELSGGQQQRVGLARALCTNARILLMDEAFSALDPLIRSQMQDQLLDLQRNLNKTIIFITHDLDEALKLGDRIAILRDGALVQEGTPEDILLNPATDYVNDFVRDVNRARALTVDTVMDDAGCCIATDNPKEALSRMRADEQDFGYVVSDDGYRGVVRKDSLRQAMNGGGDPLSRSLEALPSVAAGAAIEAALPDMLDSDLPLPVVDDEGQVIGELSPGAVAGVLGNPDPGPAAPDPKSRPAAGGAGHGP